RRLHRSFGGGAGSAGPSRAARPADPPLSPPRGDVFSGDRNRLFRQRPKTGPRTTGTSRESGPGRDPAVAEGAGREVRGRVREARPPALPAAGAPAARRETPPRPWGDGGCRGVGR